MTRLNDQRVEEPIINLPPVLARLGGDQRLLRELAGFYIEDVPALLLQLEEALATHDREGMTRAAHSIKGLSLNFDAFHAVSVAKSIEMNGKEADFEAAATTFPRLLEEIDLVIRELREQLLEPESLQ